MAAHIKVLAEELGIPNKSSTEELHQLIDNKLTDMEQELKNLQVIAQGLDGKEHDKEVCLSLVDDSGIILEVRKEFAQSRE